MTDTTTALEEGQIKIETNYRGRVGTMMSFYKALCKKFGKDGDLTPYDFDYTNEEIIAHLFAPSDAKRGLVEARIVLEYEVDGRRYVHNDVLCLVPTSAT